MSRHTMLGSGFASPYKRDMDGKRIIRICIITG